MIEIDRQDYWNLIRWMGGWRGAVEGWVKQAVRDGRWHSLRIVRDAGWRWAQVRNGLRPREPVRLPAAVISVGNLILGGSGKSPFSRWICDRVKGLGRQPALLTPVQEKGDEVEEHGRQGWRVYGDRDRVASGRRAVREGAEVLVLDDGFQYRRLMRDCDIVLWDATVPVRPDYPLLREPLDSLKRANVIVLSKLTGDVGDRLIGPLESWSGGVPVVGGFVYDPLEKWGGAKLIGVTSVSDPFYFADTVMRTGCRLLTVLAFPDHHQFRVGDLLPIREEARRSGAEGVVVTGKDQVKLDRLWDLPIPLLKLTVTLRWIFGEESVKEAIERACRRSPERERKDG